MAKQIRTGEEIQAEVSRLVHENELVKEDKAEVKIPRPTPVVNSFGGPNWTIDYVGGGSGYQGVVDAVVSKVQSRWDLAS